MGTYTRSSWEKLNVCFHLVMYRQLYCLLFFVSREYLIAYIYSLIQTRSLAKYVFRFHLLQIRFLQWIQYSCRYITKWKQTFNFSQLDRVYVPIRKKIDKCIYIYSWNKNSFYVFLRPKTLYSQINHTLQWYREVTYKNTT
jgi:hypothetical protein